MIQSTDEEAEPLTNVPYAPPRNDDSQSSFKKWSLRIGLLAAFAMAGHALMSGSSANDAVQQAGMLSSHHHESKGKAPMKPRSGKADKEMKFSGKAGKEVAAKSDKEKSSENELFDEERKLFVYIHCHIFQCHHVHLNATLPFQYHIQAVTLCETTMPAPPSPTSSQASLVYSESPSGPSTSIVVKEWHALVLPRKISHCLSSKLPTRPIK